ncbi:PLP-dependent aspartate aminotransferase family protein [Reyranella sp. CPCC 100927]|uniref:trans-sulfuration enzyme family protein n=1 Tax=Reyranella sp. CPCC 100927 TaxID=2599616 RepID=UPI0011B67F2D|nr:PLP-dependent aspartate aminotransferase family protein [Reyranella sp. CPCC 100927]TWT09617.1 PLP-dependent transferase [Reyranella sp. CPCC 100927]
MTSKSLSPESLAAQALGWVDETTRAVVPPIHVSTTYLRDPDNQYRSGRVYSRADSPNYNQPEELLAKLENGADALVFSSGMSAASACFLALAPGDHVIVSKVMYWSLRNWLMNFATHWGLKVQFVDTDRIDAVRDAIQPGQTKLIWIETPANPLWTISDIAALSDLAYRAGARLGVDSTCATPVFTRPIELGADIVMHAATKYLNGHSDVIAGALVSARKDDYWQRVRMIRGQLGTVLGALESYLLLRGMRTLFPRVRTASANAQWLAERLVAHPHVAAVLYPGLATFAGRAVAAKQMRGGFGAMMSIRVRGDADISGEHAAIATAAHTNLWKRATSLGGVESLIEHRASVEGDGTPAPSDLLRLSVGIEAKEDLLADLEQALAIAHRRNTP